MGGRFPRLVVGVVSDCADFTVRFIFYSLPSSDEWSPLPVENPQNVLRTYSKFKTKNEQLKTVQTQTGHVVTGMNGRNVCTTSGTEPVRLAIDV